MSLARLLTETGTVYVHGAGAPDEYGSPIDTWTPGPSYPSRLEQRSATEVTVDGDVQRSDWVLFLPPGAAIKGRDRWVTGGRTFEVIGPPAVLHTPDGPHHIEAQLRHLGG